MPQQTFKPPAGSGIFREHSDPGYSGRAIGESRLLNMLLGSIPGFNVENVETGDIRGRIPAGATGFGGQGPIQGFGTTFTMGPAGGGFPVPGGSGPGIPAGGGTGGAVPAAGGAVPGTVAAPAGGAGAPVAIGGTPAYATTGLGTTAAAGGAGAGAGGMGAWWSGLSTSGKIGAISQLLGLGGTAYGLYNTSKDKGKNVNVNFGGGSSAEDIGMQTLLEILLSQGATDPRALNREITGIARNTEAEQQRQQEAAARSGLTGFQGSDALQAAIAAGGTQQIADAEAREAQIAEERKRTDLNLLLDLIIGPDIQRAGIQAGVGIENQRSSDARQAALLAGLAQLFAGGSSYFNSQGG